MDCAGRAGRRRRFRAEEAAGNSDPGRAHESGVASDLPPQSNISAVLVGSEISHLIRCEASQATTSAISWSLMDFPAT